MEVIETERLLLRELDESDWKAVHEYASDPDVVRYMDWGPNTEEETKAFIQRALAAQKEKPRRHYTLAVVLKIEDKLIGTCGANVSNPENREGWIGYCLNKHYWRKGYATEVADALVDFCFIELNLHRVFATCDPENTVSAHVLEKVGMRREARVREHQRMKGKWRDSYLYSILEHEWKQSR